MTMAIKASTRAAVGPSVVPVEWCRSAAIIVPVRGCELA